MIGCRVFSFLLIVLLTQNVLCQIQLPIGSGCGCQQVSLQQSLPVPSFQLSNNCGCRNNLLANLPNGIHINNNLQIAKNGPYGTNNMQLANLQNLQLANINGLQLGNGLKLGNPLSQDLLAYANAMPMPNSCQNALQLSLQALMSQLGQQPCQCGCQTDLAPNIGNGILNANLNMLGINGMSGVTKAIGNVPCQPCGNLQVVTGQQEVVLGNNPCVCQSLQNIVNNPCPSQNIVSNSCPCENIVSNPCSCQSCQNPLHYTIYQ